MEITESYKKYSWNNMYHSIASVLQKTRICGDITTEASGTLGTFTHPFSKPLFETNIWRRQESKNNSYRLHTGHALNKISQIFSEADRSLLCILNYSVWERVPWNQTAYTQALHVSSVNLSQKTHNQHISEEKLSWTRSLSARESPQCFTKNYFLY